MHTHRDVERPTGPADQPDEHERYRVLGGISRARLLAELRRSDSPVGIRELAARVGLHPNTTREHLDRLVTAGLVTRVTSTPTGRGRPGHRYAADRVRAEQDPSAYRVLAGVLATALAGRDGAVEAATGAGEQWGAGATAGRGRVDDPTIALEQLVDLLDDLGFAPELAVDGAPSILLHHCPFGVLAHERSDVVCGVHLGLMRGALHELGAPLDAVALEPFVGPDLCHARLEARAR